MKTSSDYHLLRAAVCAILASVAVLVSATPAAAQSGPEIMQQLIDRQRERLAGIESLLIEQKVMGIATTFYLVREMVDGNPTLVPRMTMMGGMNVPLPRVALDAWSGSAEVYGEWAERFSLDGTDDIDGRPVYRLTIDDFSGIDFGASPGQDAPLTPLSGVLYVDRSDLVILRMEMDIEVAVPTGGGETRVTQLVSMLDDYREVNGYLHPFRSSVSWEGLIELLANGQDLAEMERQLAEMEQRLQNAPPAQRSLFENMLEPLRDMLSGAPMETIVTRLEVNVDPPGGR